MKTFQVVSYYPPHLGGMEFYVQHLSEELVVRGHEVTVFTSSIRCNQTKLKTNGVNVCSSTILTQVYNVPIAPGVFGSS